MSRTLAYHRPTTMEAALELLSGAGIDGVPRVVLGGGTALNAADGGREVVDLQALGLDGIADEGSALRVGAMTRLQDLADDERLGDTLRDIVRAELPSTLRTVATVGGTVASRDPDSVLLAALLAHDAEVGIVDRDGARDVPIAQWLADAAGTAIVTSATIRTDAMTATAATGRTPADTPIVAAVGCGCDGAVQVALTGVATTPVLAADDPTDGLAPAGDFRGSADYRLSLARTLTARVREALS